jgi:hypothetical protein
MSQTEIPTVLDDLAPEYDVRSQHSIWVAAPPAVVYQAARDADLGRPWLVRTLMAVRAAPAVLASVLRGRRPAAVRGKGLRSVGAAGFTLIGEKPGKEFVLGLMGRFWTPTGDLVAATADQLRSPPPAGLVQAFWSFRVVPSGEGARLTTETRVRCADPATKRRFRRYWLAIRLGSGIIRGSMLRQIRASAERGG